RTAGSVPTRASTTSSMTRKRSSRSGMYHSCWRSQLSCQARQAAVSLIGRSFGIVPPDSPAANDLQIPPYCRRPSGTREGGSGHADLWCPESSSSIQEAPPAPVRHQEASVQTQAAVLWEPHTDWSIEDIELD